MEKSLQVVTDSQIDLPAATQPDDDTTLPDINTLNQDIDMEYDMLEIANMPLDNENDALLPVDTPKQVDFVNEMNAELGINRDLELEMENLSFLEKQRDTTTVQKNTINKNPKPKCRAGKGSLKVVTDNSNKNNEQAKTPGSPRGEFTMTKHRIWQSYGPSNRQ